MPSDLDAKMSKTLIDIADPMLVCEKVKHYVGLDKKLGQLKASTAQNRLNPNHSHSISFTEGDLGYSVTLLQMPSLAVMSNNLDALKILLHEGPYLAEQALWVAVAKKRGEIVRYLLIIGTDFEKYTQEISSYSFNTTQLIQNKRSDEYLALLKKCKDLRASRDLWNKEHSGSEQESKNDKPNQVFKTPTRLAATAHFFLIASTDPLFVLDYIKINLELFAQKTDQRTIQHIKFFIHELFTHLGTAHNADIYEYGKMHILPILERYPVGKNCVFENLEELEQHKKYLVPPSTAVKPIVAAAETKMEQPNELKPASLAAVSKALADSPLHQSNSAVAVESSSQAALANNVTQSNVTTLTTR